jgi:hypothetical protein
MPSCPVIDTGTKLDPDYVFEIVLFCDTFTAFFHL